MLDCQKLDRQKLETLLSRRFPCATPQQVAASVNAIMGLTEEWEEVPCGDVSALAREECQGVEFRLLRRRAE